MNQNLREEITQLHAHICSGLSDTNRILIIYALAEHALNVGDLAERLGISQTTTSRHLKVLRERGIVRAERSGQSVYYCLTDQRVIEALDLLRAVLNDQLENRAALVLHSADRPFTSRRS